MLLPRRRTWLAFLVVFGGAVMFLGGSWVITRYLRARAGPILVEPILNRTGQPEHNETARRWSAALSARIRPVDASAFPRGAALDGFVESSGQGPRVALRMRRGRREFWSARYEPAAAPESAADDALAALRRYSSKD